LSGTGEIKESKIDNMRRMKKSYLKTVEKKEIGIVAVTLGKGFEKIFKKLGANVVIRSRKIMNPSIKDFLKAFKKVGAKNIIILPNDKNVLLTAFEAAKMKPFVSVVPTKTIPQGIHCLSYFDGKAGLEKNIEQMKKALPEINSGFITYAIEDKIYGEKNISKDDFLGFVERELISFGKNINNTTLDLMGKMIKSDSKRLTLYYGKKVQQAEADKLAELLKSRHPNIEVDIYSSGHPYYFYTISIKK
jgi:dihydroxyacetone kinase-like predicted kinase